MAFKMRSGYKPPFKQMGSSPNKSLRTIRDNQMNLTENPSNTFSGEALGEDGWNQTALDAANVDHLRRNNFEYGYRTKKGKAERKAHENFLSNRSKSTRRIDVKKSRNTGGSQLTARQVKMGMSQVQDPQGNWHTISKTGKLVGSSSGYNAASKAWRKKYSLPQVDTNTKVNNNTDNKTVIKDDKVNNNVNTNKKTTGQTFDEAFAAGRKGKKETFEWAGKKTGGKLEKFHTRLKGESDSDWRSKLGLGDKK